MSDPRKEKALELRKAGSTHAEIAAELGVHRNTVRNLLDAEAYRRNLDHSAKYAKAHPYRTRSQAVKDARNAYQRKRYSENPKVREKLNDLARKYRQSAQGYIAGKIRACTLGHAGRYPGIHEGFMVAVTGMERRAFTLQWDWPGTFDHIVPLCAFDLTNAEHLVRAMHPSNLRLVPALENQKKGDTGREVDVMSLPWVGNPKALVAATAFIMRCLGKVKRDSLESPQECPANALGCP